MTEFVSSEGSLPHIPDDLTIPQFFLDAGHPAKQMHKEGAPWLIEDGTGKAIGLKEIRIKTDALANALSSRYGVGEGTVVCIFAPNHIDTPILIWAVHRLGGIITAANPMYTTEELSHQVQTTSSHLMIAHSALLKTALAAAAEAGIPHGRVIILDVPSHQGHATVADLEKEGAKHKSKFKERHLKPGEAKTKTAFFSFSSGTTGKAKAVMVPHYAVIANAIQVAAVYRAYDPNIPSGDKVFGPGDVTTGVLPLFHIYGLVLNLHFMLFSGITVVIMPKFNFAEMLTSIVRFRMTHLVLVPPMLLLLCKHPIVKKYDLSHVRAIMSGAAPLAPELIEQLAAAFPQAFIGQGYGLTETSTALCILPRGQKVGRSGAAGRLVPGTVARVVKPDGSLAKAGETGELVVSGPQVTLGYYKDDKATRETFLEIDGKRWVRTGDEVLIKHDGDLFVVDRIKELIKVRGFQVAPAELEGHLLGHPDVADVCVVGVPDEYSGEVPLAFVVLEPKTAEKIKGNPSAAHSIKAAIQKYVADAKANYKQLAGGVEFIDQIPKNPSGKLLRKDLRAKAREARKITKFQPKL
ncbi:acetyl-CoA synthetase-like protein [Gloeophyllum trabeum ATCC 11539]|uniref:Acetyl-CoA synthetase-like protein n=1 Tax=Gloeophyllum trabeum (strain ATCC 11539 / FP-39264 / Madison 617) TaxID=670483 RepID=S7QLS1_GLOTA|nr:acetyl-CoA synthetase-like protein [Gloeophyllum trabeum ATCC 11539]EPQ60491.1 acetyl-CoA synthetase-like protein [Gloeophyllum trabeum ATCC 11539]